MGNTKLLYFTFLLLVSFSTYSEVVTDKVYPEELSLSEQAPQQIASYLELIGEDDLASEFYLMSMIPNTDGAITASSLNSLFPGRDVKAWEHTTQQLGYIENSGTFPRIVSPASQITSDQNLNKVDIRLDKIYIHDYPGRGRQKILFTFEAVNTLVNGNVENVAFNQAYYVQEGESAGVTGYPVFNDLNVSTRGAQFKGATIHVSNADDEKKLEFLESGPATTGLSLLTTAQPALAQMLNLGLNFGKLFLGRRNNEKIYDFSMGLDFDDGAAFGARLKEGSYVVVQAPDAGFNWSEWQLDSSNRMTSKNDGSLLPFNFFVFRVDKR